MSIAEKFVSMEYGPAPEDPKEAQSWLERHGHRFGHFINGAWQAPAAGAYFDTLDPSNGEKLASVAQGSSGDIDAAVRSARAAFPKWRSLTPHVRARYLYALARLVQKHSRLLAVLETMDNGKTIRESRDIDIPLVARPVYSLTGVAQARQLPNVCRWNWGESLRSSSSMMRTWIAQLRDWSTESGSTRGKYVARVRVC